MEITVQQVKELRQDTGAGVLDCRNALEEAKGDFELAKENLRKKGLAKAAKRSEREASEGVVELYSHGNGRVGVMVEVNCETDFVARSEQFREFAHEIALQIAANAPLWVREEEIPETALEQVKENTLERAEVQGKPEDVIERIIAGYVEKYKDEVCLLRQVYIRDESLKVQDVLNEAIIALGENIVIRRFQRWELGDSIEMDG